MDRFKMKGKLNFTQQYQALALFFLGVDEFVNKYRRLIFEIPNIEVKVRREVDFKPFHLYVFEGHIMAFETEEVIDIVKDTKGRAKTDWTGDVIKIKKKRNKFSSEYEISKFDLIQVRGHNTIELAAFKNAQKLHERSLEIRFKEAENLNDSLSEYVERINQLKAEADPRIKPCPEHTDHQYKFFKNKVPFVDGVMASNDQDHVICAICKNFLGGKIFTGVYCSTCQKYFHVGCFERGEPQEVESDYEETGEEMVCSPAHYNMGEIRYRSRQTIFMILFVIFSEKEAKRLLKDKKEGTFLIRWSGRRGNHYLNTNNPGREVRRIKSVNIHGEEHFYTKEGFAYKSVQELVERNKTEFNLLYPLRMPVLDEDDDIDEDEVEDDEDQQAEEMEASSEVENDDIDHGDISREKAEARLTGAPGSFLIRCNADGYKLSYFSNQERFGHYKIYKSTDGGFRQNKQKFSSIQEIANYYETSKQWRLLRNTDSGTSFENPLSDDAFGSGVESIKYYHGVLESRDAAKLLKDTVEGTYLLRKNSDEEYRITYKVWHQL